MTNIKTIFILVLSLILLFAVSCDTESKTGVKNNPPENDTEITGGGTGTGSGSGTGTGGSGTGGGGTRTLSYYAGNWYAALSILTLGFTINADGSVIMILGGNATVPSASITKNSDTSYTYHDEVMNLNRHFNFTSDTEGTITLEYVGSGKKEEVYCYKK